MKLYLLRHGEAENRAPSDAQRQLTARGRRDVQAVAAKFATMELSLDLCLCSPYTRARETAGLFLASQPLPVPLETERLLTPEVRAAQVIDLLTLRHEENILLVGHNPLLSELLALLTEGSIQDMEIVGTSQLWGLSLDIPGLGMARRLFTLSPGQESPALSPS